MQNKLALILATLSLVGCATTDPVIKTVIQRVEIPIEVPCKATVPTMPTYNFDKLTIENDIYAKSQALLADRKLHLGYETELLSALNSCIK